MITLFTARSIIEKLLYWIIIETEVHKCPNQVEQRLSDYN